MNLDLIPQLRNITLEFPISELYSNFGYITSC